MMAGWLEVKNDALPQDFPTLRRFIMDGLAPSFLYRNAKLNFGPEPLDCDEVQWGEVRTSVPEKNRQ